MHRRAGRPPVSGPRPAGGPRWAPPPGLRRLIAARRRVLAAVLAAAAVVLVVQGTRPASSGRLVVLTATRDLAAGTVLAAADVRRTSLAATAAPDGALRAAGQALGRRVAGPLRRGETLTDVRLVGRPLLRSLGPDQVAVPVAPADGTFAALLSPGDRVDLLDVPSSADGSTGTGTGAPTAAAPGRILVPGALVLAVQPAAERSSGGLGGALGGSTAGGGTVAGSTVTGNAVALLVAVPRAAGVRVAAAGAAGGIPVLLSGSTGPP